jgi:hypothetical protein
VSDSDELVKAIRNADMGELLPRLLPAAKTILRRRNWSGGEDYQPSAMEAHELVNETLIRIYEGDQKPEFDGDLRKAIVIAMTSVTASTAKKLRKVTITGELEDLERPSDGSDGDGVVLEAVEALVAGAGDPELGDFLAGLEIFGPKREDIADGLKWKPDKVSVYLKKLKRLIERSPLKIQVRKAGNE